MEISSNITSFKTSFGWISIKEKNSLITDINFDKKINKGSSYQNLRLKEYIKKYLSGKEIEWKIHLHLSGTVVQKRIWREIQRIPFGEISSYGEIAKKTKTSPRYVGRVCGQNRHLLVIPCHRVVRSDGKLGGYSGFGGTELKKKLISLEILNIKKKVT